MNPTRFLPAVYAVSIAFATFSLLASTARGQDAHKDHPTQKPPASTVDEDDRLRSEIFLELQTRLKRLEAALERDHKEAAADQSHADHSTDGADPVAPGMKQGMKMKDAGMKMGMGKMMTSSEMPMKKMGEKEMEMGRMMGMMKMMEGMKMGDMMSMKGMDMGEMMSMKGMDMGKMMKMKGMRMMGMMQNSSTMAQSALPGFPGASHIYHIGSTDFFLDHDEHIELSPAQQASLRKAREKAQLAVADFDRKIAQAEQELWVLTSSDQPDIAKISAKAKEIGNLNAESRVAYVRSVGEAAKVLDESQRKRLVGVTYGTMPDPSEHVHSEESK